MGGKGRVPRANCLVPRASESPRGYKGWHMISRACRGPRRRSPLWRFAVAAATFGDHRELGVLVLKCLMPRAAHVVAGHSAAWSCWLIHRRRRSRGRAVYHEQSTDCRGRVNRLAAAEDWYTPTQDRCVSWRRGPFGRFRRGQAADASRRTPHDGDRSQTCPFLVQHPASCGYSLHRANFATIFP